MNNRRVLFVSVLVAVVAISAAAFMPFSAFADQLSWTDHPVTGRTGSEQWRGFGMSSDGQTMAVSGFATQSIFVSTSTGASWVPENAVPGDNDVHSIAMSADGSKMFAAVRFEYIYVSTSTPSAWATSTLPLGNQEWYGITSSSDGTKLAAAALGGYVYTSTDSGTTWSTSTNAGARSWFDITSASYGGDGSTNSGNELIAAARDDGLYMSLNGGANWGQTATSLGNGLGWYTVAASWNGANIIAGTNPGYLYISHNGGATWATSTDPGSKQWYKVAMSHDGSTIIATNSRAGSAEVWVSKDSGATWTQQTDSILNSGTQYWRGAAVSGDGSLIALADGNGDIYTSGGVAAAPSTLGGCGTMYEREGNTTYAISCGIKKVYSVDPAPVLSGAGAAVSLSSSSTSAVASSSVPAVSVSLPASTQVASSTVVTALIPTAAAPAPASSGRFAFVNNLKLGDSNPDVWNLQRFLAGQGLFSHALTMHFGSATRAAVVAFQKAHGIAPAIGYFGPMTRAYVNSH